MSLCVLFPLLPCSCCLFFFKKKLLYGCVVSPIKWGAEVWIWSDLVAEQEAALGHSCSKDDSVETVLQSGQGGSTACRRTGTVA